MKPPYLPAEPITPIDRAWLRMDEPDNLMIITGVMVFERMDLATLRNVARSRLPAAKRFRQRLERRDGRFSWVDEGAIDAERHVRSLTLEPPSDKAALERAVGKLMAEPLSWDEPLWRFYLVEDMEGKSVLVTRMHHSMGDGVGLMMVLLSLTDLSAVPAGVDGSSPFRALLSADPSVREAAVEKAREIMPEVINLMSRVSGGAGGNRLRAARGMTAALARLTAKMPDPKTAFKGRLGREKSVAWSRPVALDRVKAIKDDLGGTINDVLLTAMSGGLRRYLEARGQQVEGLDLRAAVPVSLRRLDQLADLGNRFGLVFLGLPVGMAEPRARLAELRRRMRALKRSYEAPVAMGVLHGMGRSPKPVQRLVERIFGTKATAVMTNVPGPRAPLFLGGARIEDLIFWVPQSGRLGLGISILSYNQRVRLGVATDTGLVPDPHGIIAAFHDELDAMAALTGD